MHCNWLQWAGEIEYEVHGIVAPMDTIDNRLPLLIHIGTQKAVSTYLYNLLTGHPDAGLSTYTEVNFFSTRFEKGIDWYQNVFPPTGKPIDCSPTYFKGGESVAQRIKETYGAKSSELRFLLILRNPIDYVQSHFSMQRQQDFFTKRSDLYPVPPDSLSVCARMYPEYLKRGKYAELLEEWLRYFRRDQFLIVPFEWFVKNESDAMAQILAFWGLPERTLTAAPVSHNKALRFGILARLRDVVLSYPKLKSFLKGSRAFQYVLIHFLTASTKESITPQLRRELSEVFAADVKKLSAHGVTTSYWKDFQNH